MKIYDSLSPADKRLWINTLNEIVVLNSRQHALTKEEEPILRNDKALIRSMIAKVEAMPKATP